MVDFFEGGEEGWGVSLKNNPDYMMCRIYRISLNFDPYIFTGLMILHPFPCLRFIIFEFILFI